MAVVASTLYHAADDKVTSEVIALLKETLDAYEEDLIDLAQAMEGLVRFTILLEQKYDDKTGAKRLVNLMRSYMHLYEPFWRRVSDALRRVSTQQHSAFLTFLDADMAPKDKAPKFGEKPPEGTIPARDLVSTARPPPHVRRKKRR